MSSDWIDVKDALPKVSNTYLLCSRAMLVHAKGMNFTAIYHYENKEWIALTEPNLYKDGWRMDVSKSEIVKHITHWKNMDVPSNLKAHDKEKNERLD